MPASSPARPCRSTAVSTCTELAYRGSHGPAHRVQGHGAPRQGGRRKHRAGPWYRACGDQQCMKALARHPAAMERFAAEMTAAFTPGKLDPLTKELLYLAVSITNQCDYCIASHSAMARAKGLTEEMHEEFMAVVLAAQKGNKITTAYRVPVDAAFEEK